MRRNTKFALVALAGAAVGAVLGRLRRPAAAPAGEADERTEELRRKLAEARVAAAEPDDFEVAGMGAETIVEEPPAAEPPAAPAEPAPAEPAAEEPAPAAEPEPPPALPTPAPAAKGAEVPQDEFEAMRRRIHEEGKAAADEMRRSSDAPDQTQP